MEMDVGCFMQNILSALRYHASFPLQNVIAMHRAQLVQPPQIKSLLCVAVAVTATCHVRSLQA